MNRTLMFVFPAVVLAGLIGWRLVQKHGENAGLQAAQSARSKAPASVVSATASSGEILKKLQIVGTLESPYNVRLAPKLAGLITYLEAREGTAVKKGDVLIRIDPTEINGQVLAGLAAVAEAGSRLAQAQITQSASEVGVQSQIEQQKASVASAAADYNQENQNYAAQVAAADASVADTDAKVDAAQSGVENAKADLESAKANADNANAKFKRSSDLFEKGYISAQDFENAKTSLQVAQAAVKVAEGQVRAANSGLKSAQSLRNAAGEQAAIVRRKVSADVEAAHARWVQSQASLKAAQANLAQVPAYKANVDALKASVSAAQGELRQAQARLADTAIKSPIDGTVTARLADPGAVASPGQAVLVVQYLGWLYVTASVPLEYSSTVTQGSNAKFTVDALPNRIFSGTVAEVNRAANPQNRQFMIRLRVDNAQGLLRPGMFARLELVTQRKRVPILVPLEAVKRGATSQGKTVTRIDPDGTAHVVPVVTGDEDDKNVEITEGLKPGEKVVVLSAQPVRDGQKVSEGSTESEGSGGRRRRGGP